MTSFLRDLRLRPLHIVGLGVSFQIQHLHEKLLQSSLRLALADLLVSLLHLLNMKTAPP